MFIQNKYTFTYFRIIERAKNRLLDCYHEKHHIIPKCLGGDDSDSNLVDLTAKEHFVCHHLLTKMVKTNKEKINYAFIIMMCNNPRQQREYRLTSSHYAKRKEYNSILASTKFSGKQKHNVGKKKFYDPVTHQMYLLFPDDPKTEFLIQGVSPTVHKGNKHGIGLGKYAYNITTGEVKRFIFEENVPDGWVLGNPNAATRTATDTILFHHHKTGETKRIPKDVIPSEEWIKGSPYIWINNGSETKQHNPFTSSLPEGWVIGRIFKKKKGKVNES